jgi:cytosine deaminase
LSAAAAAAVFCGIDNTRDHWNPYGTGEMLERATVIGWRLDARTDSALEALFGMVEEAGAKALEVEPPAVAVAEAIGQHLERGVVVFEERQSTKYSNHPVKST